MDLTAFHRSGFEDIKSGEKHRNIYHSRYECDRNEGIDLRILFFGKLLSSRPNYMYFFVMQPNAVKRLNGDIFMIRELHKHKIKKIKMTRFRSIGLVQIAEKFSLIRSNLVLMPHSPTDPFSWT